MGNGFCAEGYYKGWADDVDHGSMTLEACAQYCRQEEECKYFALAPGDMDRGLPCGWTQ
jgi:hypothetical protein